MSVSTQMWRSVSYRQIPVSSSPLCLAVSPPRQATSMMRGLVPYTPLYDQVPQVRSSHLICSSYHGARPLTVQSLWKLKRQFAHSSTGLTPKWLPDLPTASPPSNLSELSSAHRNMLRIHWLGELTYNIRAIKDTRSHTKILLCALRPLSLASFATVIGFRSSVCFLGSRPDRAEQARD